MRCSRTERRSSQPMDKISRTCICRRRRGIEPVTGNSERLLRTKPRFSLNGAGLLMRQKSAVDCQRTAVTAVADTAFFLAIVQKAQKHRQHLRCIGDGRRMRDRAGDVGNAVVHDAVYNVARLVMGGRMACFDCARFVV